jgi:streptomycin 6-kinase
MSAHARGEHQAAAPAAAWLLAHDVERHAMLLESLGPSMDLLGLAPEIQLNTLCRLLRQAWEVPPTDGGRCAAPRDKASALHHFVDRLWEDLDTPCSEPVVTQALKFAERRAAAFDPDRCVVVHGDAAPPNALKVRAPRDV